MLSTSPDICATLVAIHLEERLLQHDQGRQTQARRGTAGGVAGHIVPLFDSFDSCQPET